MKPSAIIPVRLVGSDRVGTETFIGDFPGGLAAKDNYLVDLRDNQTVAFLNAYRGKNSQESRYFWVVPKLENKKFSYLFMQCMPSDAPVEVTMSGKKMKLF